MARDLGEPWYGGEEPIKRGQWTHFPAMRVRGQLHMDAEVVAGPDSVGPQSRGSGQGASVENRHHRRLRRRRDGDPPVAHREDLAPPERTVDHAAAVTSIGENAAVCDRTEGSHVG